MVVWKVATKADKKVDLTVATSAVQTVATSAVDWAALKVVRWVDTEAVQWAGSKAGMRGFLRVGKTVGSSAASMAA